jgi:hypothetical protein
VKELRHVGQGHHARKPKAPSLFDHPLGEQPAEASAPVALVHHQAANFAQFVAEHLERPATLHLALLFDDEKVPDAPKDLRL